MEITIENIELLYTPYTKKLLINYVSIQFQEEADYSDESLKSELIWLYENNQLDQLILAEFLSCEARQIINVHEN
ncbi:hypothetical protein [Tenacibaculum maritimum]|uniref:hypothetical protein n=1 Tax=Tenacibaculum maritimum TaxID=107401 RepID=UPI0012E52682|nr:hypothetical protein [Tenacibaculum maritimum]MCD9581247.1 hypothetical protein [Tenacibaculum maritimum]MCD9635224.1 hypothetical protein [Tenacibaculum maritimum]CAA0260937.1 conserved hypothetical protein [Tenacibaculum maritimum]